MRFAAGIEYNGALYRGWQRQRGARTVQEAVETALSRVADHPVEVVTAGRTDTGVHASGQTVHFDSSSRRTEYQWWRGANSQLPEDVRVLWVQPVADDFHARFRATQRSYRYIVLNRPIPSALVRQLTSWDYRPLDIERMQRAAARLLGRHDFSAFRAAGCQAHTPLRTVSQLLVQRSGDWVWLDISADAFLQHMVRNIVGVLSSIGCGERPVEWAATVLDSRDRTQAGVTAAPEGLYLTAVLYPDRYRLPVPQPGPRFW